MHWADQFAKAIVDSGKHKPYWVDDMKTPSGRVHIGSVRAVVTHELIYRALTDKKAKATFSYVLEDHDPMDGLPVYLDEKKFRPHLGKPLFQIPSPEPGFKSFGDRWGQEYEEIFNSLGVHPLVLWGSQLYLSGRMNEVIKICLDQAETIRQIYLELYGPDSKPKGWIPFNVVCENCGKLSTTIISKWDGEFVHYSCPVEGLDWTEGCGHEGKASPFSTKDYYAGKLPWKVEWACKWKVIGVTIEGAGKDHMTEGGSHDVSRRVCERVINYPVPFNFSHEFFLTGGRKMSSSKGIGSSAKEVTEIIPPYLIRFLITRVKYNRAINFDPMGDTIPDLFDAYDQAALAFWSGENQDLARVFELSQIKGAPPPKHFLPRFREITKILQDPKLDLANEMAKQKGSKLTGDEQKVLDERVKYARIWLERYAPTEAKVGLIDKTESTSELTADQKKYLKLILPLLTKTWKSPEDLQQELYQIAKDNSLNPKTSFQSIYLALTGKTFGPKAAWLMLDNDQKLVAGKFNQAITFKKKVEKIVYKYPLIHKPEIVSIGKDMVKAYPSMQIGMAVIRGVNNQLDNQPFIKFREEVVAKAKNITLEEINSSVKISSYRRAIRESGVDWHKRRPTMEALLRRLAQGKNIDWINPLVDIANLMAIKHHMSEGVFDLNSLNLPAVMKRSAGREKVLMIGDKEPITLQRGEICYFDKVGPFIVDLCWRDAQRTGATQSTKDILFLSEAVYDITRLDLDIMLDDTINTVTKYLGGQVETAGVITAK